MTPMSENPVAVTQALDRAERYAKSLHTTPEEHDDIMTAVRLARGNAWAAGLEREADGAPGGEDCPFIAGNSWKEPEDDCWTSEVQIVGGHYVVATVHGATQAEAEARRDAVLAALTKPTPPASVSDSEADPVIMIEVESVYDRHTYTFTSRVESEAFLTGARNFPGITVTSIEERHVADAEYALGGLPEMLEAQDD